MAADHLHPDEVPACYSTLLNQCVVFASEAAGVSASRTNSRNCRDGTANLGAVSAAAAASRIQPAARGAKWQRRDGGDQPRLTTPQAWRLQVQGESTVAWYPYHSK